MLKKRGFLMLLIFFILVLGLMNGCSSKSERKAENIKELTELNEEEATEEIVLEEPSDEDIVDKTFGIDVPEFEKMWLQLTDKVGMERIHSISNVEYLDVENDEIIYKAEINDYIKLQARLDSENEEIKNICFITISTDVPSNISLDISLAAATLLAIIQPELTADERGDILETKLGLGMKDTDLNKVNNDYVLNEASYVFINIGGGLLYFGVNAGTVPEIMQAVDTPIIATEPVIEEEDVEKEKEKEKEEEKEESEFKVKEETINSNSDNPIAKLTKSIKVENPVSKLSESSVHAEIKKTAKNDHPDDYSTQNFVVEEQMSAYEELKWIEIDTNVKQNVLNNAMKDHPYDFSTQQFVYEEQMQSYEELKELVLDTDVKLRVLKNAMRDHPYDFSTQQFVYEEQMEDYDN